MTRPSPTVSEDSYGFSGPHKTVRVKAGRHKRITLVGQNDGSIDDTLGFYGCSSSSGFVVSYISLGTDVTAEMTLETFTTPLLSPGGSVPVVLAVKVKKHDQRGEYLACQFLVTSLGDGLASDEVYTKVKVR